ncbi:MAG: hypothetical protein ACRDD3_12470 [Azovibrio sp.]
MLPGKPVQISTNSFMLRSLTPAAHVLAKNYRMLFNFKDNPRFVLEGSLEQECRMPAGGRAGSPDIFFFQAPCKWQTFGNIASGCHNSLIPENTES